MPLVPIPVNRAHAHEVCLVCDRPSETALLAARADIARRHQLETTPPRPSVATRTARGQAWVAQHAAETRLFDTEGWHVAAVYSLTMPDGGQRAVDAARLYEAAGYEVVLKSAVGDCGTLRVIIRSLALAERGADLDAYREHAADDCDLESVA